LRKLQHGEEPDDWKPMSGIGAGVREIRIRERSGAFRIIYVAHLKDAIYVLHAFRKKTRKTSTRDLDLARERFRSMRGDS
jgi:phage-related protein